MTNHLDARGLQAALFNDGYPVFRRAVPTKRCQAVLDAIAQDLGISADDPESWDRVSAELDQVPLWGHQSQWDIRQDSAIHRVWSAVWGTQRLWIDRNSCRFTPPWQTGRADPLALHWDADPAIQASTGTRASLPSPTPAKAGSAVHRPCVVFYLQQFPAGARPPLGAS